MKNFIIANVSIIFRHHERRANFLKKKKNATKCDVATTHAIFRRPREFPVAGFEETNRRWQTRRARRPHISTVRFYLPSRTDPLLPFFFPFPSSLSLSLLHSHETNLATETMTAKKRAPRPDRFSSRAEITAVNRQVF